MEQIDERIKEVMANVFGIDSSAITEESSQDNIDMWDSLKHLDLIVAIEEEFNILIPIEEVGNMSNYKYIKIIIEEQLGK